MRQRILGPAAVWAMEGAAIAAADAARPVLSSCLLFMKVLRSELESESHPNQAIKMPFVLKVLNIQTQIIFVINYHLKPFIR
jgi:hypothetical protein